MAGWTPKLDRSGAPLYLSIADAIAADVAAGVLAPGTRLPPQRALADALGIDFTTVSRAYAEARRRGLIEAAVGQGTFVRRRPAPPAGSLADMSMNMPPAFDDPALAERLQDGLARLADGGLELLLRYHEPGGTAGDRAAAAAWLSGRLPGVAPERLLVCPGAQGALLAVAGTLAAPGEAICTEALSYAGFRSLAAFLRIPLLAVAIDDQGLIPEALDAVCREHRPKALYCTPTLHNPTAATMTPARRQAIVAVARTHRLPIIEDDAYGPFVPDLPPLAALAPELGYYVGGLAKVLSPALRIAYLAAPDASVARRLAGALRGTAGMASPLGAALATRWIEDGTARAVCGAIAREADARRAIARRRLPAGTVIPDHGFHLWLTLPAPWGRSEFAQRLRAAGIGVVASDAFAVGPPPEAVRLGLGSAASRDALADGLALVADLLAQSPALSSLVV